MNRTEFDKLFDEIFEKVVKEQQVVPDPDVSWNRIKDKVGARAKNRSRRKYAAIAAIIAAVVMVIASPAIPEAYNPFRSIIQSIRQGTLSFILENAVEHRGTTPPPDDRTGTVLYEYTARKLIFDTWDEAKALFATSPPEIGYIPDAYNPDIVMLFVYDHTGADRAMLSYSAPDQEQPLTIVFQRLDENGIYTSTSDVPAGRLSEVELNGTKGLLLERHDGTASLEFMIRNFAVTISGKLPNDEIERIGKSIRI